MSDKETRYVVCIRVSECLNPVAMSVKGTCVECLEAVWLSPQAKAVPAPYTVMCTKCALEKMVGHPDVEFRAVPGSEALLDSLAARLRARQN